MLLKQLQSHILVDFDALGPALFAPHLSMLLAMFDKCNEKKNEKYLFDSFQDLTTSLLNGYAFIHKVWSKNFNFFHMY